MKARSQSEGYRYSRDPEIAVRYSRSLARYTIRPHPRLAHPRGVFLGVEGNEDLVDHVVCPLPVRRELTLAPASTPDTNGSRGPAIGAMPDRHRGSRHKGLPSNERRAPLTNGREVSPLVGEKSRTTHIQVTTTCCTLVPRLGSAPTVHHEVPFPTSRTLPHESSPTNSGRLHGQSLNQVVAQLTNARN